MRIRGTASDHPTLLMSSQKAVTAVRPAVSGLARRVWQAECPHQGRYSTRAFSIPASRPRKVSRQWHQSLRCASSEAPKEQLGRTKLYELHNKHGAKFVPFGGYSMPVQYNDQSIIDSHNWTREKASLFDVGHM